MKKIAFLPLVLAACVSNPMTYQQIEWGVSHYTVGNTCYRKGWVDNPPVMSAYLGAIQSALSTNGDPALISQAQSRMSTATVTRDDCRQLEMYAWQHAQQQAEAARQRESFRQSMDSVSQSAQQTQSYTPRTVTCQHYQWGNMTSCSSY